MDTCEKGLKSLEKMLMVERLLLQFFNYLLWKVDEPMTTFELLVMLKVHGTDRATFVGLARDLMSTRSAVSAAVGRLEDLRLVCRHIERDVEVTICLSDDGLQLLQRISGAFLDIKDEWLSKQNSSNNTISLDYFSSRE